MSDVELTNTRCFDGMVVGCNAFLEQYAKEHALLPDSMFRIVETIVIASFMHDRYTIVNTIEKLNQLPPDARFIVTMMLISANFVQNYATNDNMMISMYSDTTMSQLDEDGNVRICWKTFMED